MTTSQSTVAKELTLAERVAAMEHELARLRSQNDALRARAASRFEFVINELVDGRVINRYRQTFPLRAGDVEAPPVHHFPPRVGQDVERSRWRFNLKPELVQLAPSVLIPTTDNPRVMREDKAFAELVESIRSVGVLQPLIARPMPSNGKRAAGTYDLRAGHRRLAAAKKAGLETVPVIVREMDDKLAIEITVTENLQRENLHPLEEARGIKHMLDAGWTPEAAAERFGKTAAWVAKRAKLLDLTSEWQKSIEDPKSPVSVWPAALLDQVACLPADSQAIVLSNVNPDRQGNARRLGNQKGIVPTAQELAKYIASEVLNVLHGAPFKLDDETLVPAAGSCVMCPKRSGCQPLLFDELDAGGKKGRKADAGQDRCLDRKCYDGKVAAIVRRRLVEASAKHGKSLPVMTGGYDYQLEYKLKKVHPGLCHVYDGYGTKPKPGEKGAVCGIIVNGPGAGAEKWVWDRSYVASSPSSRSKKKEAGKPTSLAERKKGLEGRRVAHVITAIREQLDKLARGKGELPKAACTPAMAIKLAATFGTEHNERHHDDKDWAGLDDRAPADLVRKVLPVLHDRLTYYNGEQALKRRTEAQRCAALIELDWDQLVAAAETEIPTPKGWANLNADGTPKSAKKSAVKKARKAVRK